MNWTNYARTVARESGPRFALFSYHFPPGTAAGALRWEKLLYHAAARGWHADVFSLSPRALARTDLNRVERLPRGTRVFGIDDPPYMVERLEAALWRFYQGNRSAKGRELAGHQPSTPGRAGSLHRGEVRWNLHSLRGVFRAYQAWLEYARTGAWARKAARAARDLTSESELRFVVSSGPPHMAHEGARRLARTARLPLVVDLRDPWSLYERLPEHLASGLWYRLAARMERRVVRDAALIAMNNEPAASAMRVLYPEHANRIIAVMNGIDDEPVDSSSPTRDRFVIAYAGSIYLDRSPRTLFHAVARVVRAQNLEPSDLSTEFMGSVDGLGAQRISEMAASAGIADRVRIYPPANRDEVDRFLAGASLLVSLAQDSHLAIPSKIFDYMRHEAWMLALAAPHSATAMLLADTGADVVSPDDVEAVARVIGDRYREFRSGKGPPRIWRTEFTRRAQADVLFDAIEALTGTPRGAPR